MFISGWRQRCKNMISSKNDGKSRNYVKFQEFHEIPQKIASGELCPVPLPIILHQDNVLGMTFFTGNENKLIPSRNEKVQKVIARGKHFPQNPS